MTEFDYTKEFDVNSEWVEGVYYNENDETLVLDLDDDMYRYAGVPADAVGALVEARETNGSVGAYYNTFFKGTYGPAEYLGNWDDVYLNPISPKVASGGVKKDFNGGSIIDALRVAVTDLTNASNVQVNNYGGTGATKEYSLKTPEAVSEGSDEAPTKEFSLKTPEAPVVESVSEVTTTLYFDLDGGDKVYEFTHEGDLDETAEELNRVVSRVGATGRIRKAVIEFV